MGTEDAHEPSLHPINSDHPTELERVRSAETKSFCIDLSLQLANMFLVGGPYWLQTRGNHTK